MKHGSIRFAFLLLYGHPLNTDTSLLRTVVFVAVKSPYSLNSTRLIQTPVNMRTTDTCFVPNKQIVMDSLPAVINLFFYQALNWPSGWQHVDLSSSTVYRIGRIADFVFRVFWHQTSYAENGFWINNISMSAFWIMDFWKLAKVREVRFDAISFLISIYFLQIKDVFFN